MPSIFKQLSNPVVKRNIIILAGCWMVSCFCYYLILFYIQYIPGNIFENTIYSAAADTSGYVLTGVLFQYIGGKKSLVISFVVAAISGTGMIMCTPLYPGLIPLFLFGSKLGVSAAYNVVYIVNVLVFPADFKTTSFGICNFFARIAGIVAPMAANLEQPVPLYLFVSTCGVYAFLSLLLIEKRDDETLIA